MEGRIATVRVGGGSGKGGEGEDDDLRRRLSRVLLAGSPRIMLAGPALGRLDARGWERRGGEEALGRTLLEAAREEGLAGASVGVADVPVAADAAARVAASAGPGAAAGAPSPDRTGGAAAGGRIRVVAPGEARAFLAPLPLGALPLRDGLRETFRALGLRRVDDLARLDRREVEARFGPEGVRAHRWSRGEDDRPLPFASPASPPSASLELDTPARSTEPLLFALRQLLHRLCVDLAGEGRCAARVTMSLALEAAEGEEEVEREVTPARPTRREDLLFDLCRAALERGTGGALPAPVEGISLRVDDRAPPVARQEDLFAAGDRDPLEATAALSRLRTRLGPDAVVRPAGGKGHRPEARDAWRAVEPGEDPGPGGGRGARRRGRGGREEPASPEGRGSGEEDGAALAGVLRLLPEPEPVEVSCREGRPVALRDRRGRHRVETAEGPERISGSWWRTPYAREYWWVYTDARELLWIFRDHPPAGGPRWRLHGWWD